jgi:hypothetical protein
LKDQGSFQRKAELLDQAVKWYHTKNILNKKLINKAQLYEFITLGKTSYYGVLPNGRSETEQNTTTVDRSLPRPAQHTVW